MHSTQFEGRSIYPQRPSIAGGLNQIYQSFQIQILEMAFGIRRLQLVPRGQYKFQ